jgi:hypothetical protein
MKGTEGTVRTRSLTQSRKRVLAPKPPTAAPSVSIHVVIEDAPPTEAYLALFRRLLAPLPAPSPTPPTPAAERRAA